MRRSRASGSHRTPRRSWRGRALDQLGTVGLALGAIAAIAAKYTDRGRTGFLWLDNSPVDRVFASLSYAFAGLGAIATAVRLEALGRKAARADDAESLELALIQEIRRELRQIVEDMQLYSSGRMSVFLRGESCFYLVGRFSLMDRFNRCSGRQQYELGEGVLGLAGDRGAAEVVGLPNPGSGPEPNARWLTRQRDMGVGDEHARTMTMRSRSYAGLRLNFENRIVGVLVAESELEQGATLSQLEECTEAQTHLSRLLDHSSRVDPSRLRAALTRCLTEGHA
jgi:hypothetical protein